MFNKRTKLNWAYKNWPSPRVCLCYGWICTSLTVFHWAGKDSCSSNVFTTVSLLSRSTFLNACDVNHTFYSSTPYISVVSWNVYCFCKLCIRAVQHKLIGHKQQFWRRPESAVKTSVILNQPTPITPILTLFYNHAE